MQGNAICGRQQSWVQPGFTYRLLFLFRVLYFLILNFVIGVFVS